MNNKFFAFIFATMILGSSTFPVHCENQSFLKKGSINSKIWNSLKVVLGAATVFSSYQMQKSYLDYKETFKETEKEKEKHYDAALINASIANVKKQINREPTEDELSQLKEEMNKVEIAKNDASKKLFNKSHDEVQTEMLNKTSNPYKTNLLFSTPTFFAGFACIVSGVKGLQEDFSK